MSRLFNVQKLQELADPLTNVVWCDELKRPLRRAEIVRAVEEKRFFSSEQRFDKDRGTKPLSRRLHIERVAWFVVHGWDDPIQLDVGIPFMNFHVSWVIQDGNHRFLAAIVRGDRSIAGEASGAVSEIRRLCRRGRS